MICGGPTRWVAVVLLLLLVGGLPRRAGAGSPEDDFETFVPGLIASFSASSAPEAPPTAVRVVADLNEDWGDGAPDPRVPADGFRARWAGWLLIQSPGRHRFWARTEGQARVTISDRVVADASGAAARSETIELPAGPAPLVVESEHPRGPARLAIDWEGPNFDREPVPARLLFHDPQGQASRPDRFEEGRRQADRLGCANCHAVLDLPRHAHLGPSLSDAGRTIDRDWLRRWLADPITLRPETRMPAFGPGLSPQEVADLAAFLRRPAPAATPAPTQEIQMALNVADPVAGRTLFRSFGCLGCHTRGREAAVADEDRAAPDLADLGRKRTTSWLATSLARPKANQPGRHRPDLHLTADAAAHLAAYLVSDPPPAPSPRDLPSGDPDRGRTLAETLRCASCHAIPGLTPRPADRPLGPGADPKGGCLADVPRERVPRFALTDDQRRALRSFVAGLPLVPSPTPPRTRAQDTIRRLSCLGCHARDGRGGKWLGTQLASLLAHDPALGARKGTLTPPDLSAVGDKLRPEYLALAVRGRAPTARPWLSVRMPEFPFEPGEAEALVSFLSDHDRPALEPAPVSEPPAGADRLDAATEERAVTLLGRQGFGCVSCHVLAGKMPPGGEPETLGPDLALAHLRMTGRYFHRWIADPQRILPGTPMPQFVLPVATVPAPLADQLDTIWRLLGSARVAEVAAFGTRAILERQGDRALVVRDMVVLPDGPGGPYNPRGLAIGLKNGHSLLFDADRLAWVSWWRGGFLSRTKTGRLWEWHVEGEPLWTARQRHSPLVFLGPGGRIVVPEERRERFGSFSELLFEGDGVVLKYILGGPSGGPVPVEERIVPTEGGWERRVRVEDVPEGFRPLLATWGLGPGDTPARVTMTRSSPGVYEARVAPTPGSRSGP